MPFELSKIDACDHGIERIHQLKRVILHKKTARQMVEIDEYENYGVGVWLDGWPQCAEGDSAKYHESFVHQALLPYLAYRQNAGTLDQGIKVCILGGGDFGVAYELCRYKAVTQIHQVDWDPEFMEMAKEHLEAIHHGSWQDPRVKVELEMGDAFEFLPKTTETYDVIFGDLTDLANLNELMPNFAALLARIMREDALFITQAGELSNVPAALEVALDGYKSLAPHFKKSWVSRIYIPSFAYEQSFLMTTNNTAIDPLALPASEVDNVIAENIAGELSEYSGAVHHALFALPPSLRKILGRELGSGFAQAPTA